MSAFSIPLSGLAATSSEMKVIANNLANLNTDGYKNQSLVFGDLFNQMQQTSGNGDPIQVGSGVKVAGQSADFSNGNVTSTGIASNMALQGNGFFVVEGNNQVDYTRAGNFTVNSSGQLTTQSGELVMGYPAVNGMVSSSTSLSPITVNQPSTLPAKSTSSFQMNTNLDSGAAVGDSVNSPITVYDSLGETHVMNVQFTKTGTNSWSYSVTVPAADVGGTGSPVQVATGALAFDSNGLLTSPTGSITGITVPGLADGASPLNLTWNLNSASGTSLLTQQSGSSGTSSTNQDGFGVGTLTGYSVLADGTVQGAYSNSETLALGQVAVASFANIQGLAQSGNGNYEATFASGAAVIGKAGAAGNGNITGGSVESSNVDLSTQFAHMIVAQQGYEANAKVLTTLNQVSQATIQIVS